MIQISDVRLFLRDRPEYNRLLDREEFSSEQIDQAMKLTVMAFNELSPATQFPVQGFPHQYLLLIGTVYHLFFGGGILRSRNRLSYQTDGVAIDDESHAEVELSMSAQLRQEFQAMAKDKKIEANVNAGYGHVPSEYIGAFRYSWMKEV